MRRFFETHVEALSWAQEREDEGYECVLMCATPTNNGGNWIDTDTSLWYVDTYLIPEELIHV